MNDINHTRPDSVAYTRLGYREKRYQEWWRKKISGLFQNKEVPGYASPRGTNGKNRTYCWACDSLQRVRVTHLAGKEVGVKRVIS